ncbi:MAG: hypothetical protein MJK10_02355 [Pseudomonadales bacterium]|nr:hypothetical protein [Pseudomonadales bacterium]NRA14709.1 hypothetical protein [Oceanospirillaceae bacterium]
MMAENNLANPYGKIDQQQLLLQRIFIGNLILAATLVIAAIAIAIAFVFEDNFVLGVQIAAHISLIICSISLKVGYLLRSFSLKKLGSNKF